MLQLGVIPMPGGRLGSQRRCAESHEERVAHAGGTCCRVIFRNTRAGGVTGPSNIPASLGHARLRSFGGAMRTNCCWAGSGVPAQQQRCD